MSAKLLRDVGKMHELEDDLESFLHVLGWTTLRYLPADASYSSHRRGQDLERFDEYHKEPGRSCFGGDAKASMLRGGGYPSEYFHPRQPTPLSGLLRALSSPFKSIYSLDPPDAALRSQYEALKKQHTNESSYDGHSVHTYDLGIERSKSSLWFITTVRDALANVTWPTDDKANPELPMSFFFTTDGEEVRKMNRRHHTYDQWVRSKTLPGSSKRSGSPTPESGTKRRRGTPSASGSGI